ncbi:MAG: redoxin domain-containing protein [Sphingobacteriales bacterium]|nr:redoxin domain-containing protein [Sphingobacteriales bacterium]
MKKILFAALPIAAFALMPLKLVNDPLPIGSAIPNPEIKMKDISGTEVSFKDAQKKNGLLVVFSCNTCPVVKRLQTRLNEVSKYALEHNIGVILLNPNEAYRDNGDSYDDMKDYAKQNGFDWYYVLDENSAMADKFGANRTPELFLFDKDLKLSYHGAIDDNSNSPEGVTRKHAIVAMDELSAGKEISMKETRSVGCTIKRKS